MICIRLEIALLKVSTLVSPYTESYSEMSGLRVQSMPKTYYNKSVKFCKFIYADFYLPYLMIFWKTEVVAILFLFGKLCHASYRI